MTGFEEWADRYQRIFNLNTDEHVNMFAEWHRVFQAKGITAAQLEEATDFLAVNPPKARGVPVAVLHLSAITERIKSRSHVAKQDPLPAWRGRCEIEGCRDGLVTVPHPKAIVNGQWVKPWYSMGVACYCERGQSLNARFVRLEQYEREVPGWRLLYERRQSAGVG